MSGLMPNHWLSPKLAKPPSAASGVCIWLNIKCKGHIKNAIAGLPSKPFLSLYQENETKALKDEVKWVGLSGEKQVTGN